MLNGKGKAYANIALVKYWGKRNAEQNLPAKGSLSLTIRALETNTVIRFVSELAEDKLSINGSPTPLKEGHIRVLDWFRNKTKESFSAHIESTNNFPTASGLASSASGMAALVLAADNALDLNLDPKTLSQIARLGSGSAARSIYPGFAEMHAGPTSNDCFATPLAYSKDWDLRMVICVNTTAAKKHSSTDAMNLCEATSPYYRQWLETVDPHIVQAKKAIANQDLDLLGDVMEQSCLAMHSAIMASVPGILFWNPSTLRGMEVIQELRADGIPAFFTIDAGPHLKVLTTGAHQMRVCQTLQAALPESQLIVSGVAE